MTNDNENLFNLHKKILDSDGMRFLNKIRTHGFTYSIFLRNYKRLAEIIAIKDAEKILKLNHRENIDEREKFFEAVSQETHNFLASCITLVDHTRAFVKNEYSSHSFKEEYDKKILEITKNNICFFIKDLRNYVIHKGLPPLNFRMNIINNSDGLEISYSILLNIEKLLEWDKWHSASKIYIRSFDKNIDLEDLSKNYWSLISLFYKWFEERLYEIHKNELQELKTLNKKNI